MKTKDFIKILQEADPSGEAHIRMSGGIPTFAELKEGYWDGPYSYIDDDGNYVYSSMGTKVDIWCTDIDGFIEEHMDIHSPNNWEYVKSKFKFELSYTNPDQKNEKINRVLDEAKESYDMYYEIINRLFLESEERAINNANKGYKFFQNKLVDDKTLKPNLHHYFTWKIIDENGKDDLSNVYNTQGVFKSDKFEKLDNDEISGYYEWILK